VSGSLEYVRGVYDGNNGDATRELYRKLGLLGPIGVIALNLFRAHKTSAAAKRYRGRQYKGAAYDRKDWSIGNLAEELERLAAKAGLRWGWGYDPRAVNFEHVVYVDLPTGQVSFHTSSRRPGPDYPGAWDGEVLIGDKRIVQWCADLLDGRASTPITNKPASAPAQEQPASLPSEQEGLPL
jgi:hypothetical protein